MLLLGACSTGSRKEIIDIEDGEVSRFPESPLQSQLRMDRSLYDLGFAEARFNPCQYGLKNGAGCAPQYMTVVHFQLLCRDTEGTVSNVPVHIIPLTSETVRWSLGGISGHTRTNSEGYSQLTMVTGGSTRGKQLVLRIGKQFLGFTASDLSKVVLPKNFCS